VWLVLCREKTGSYKEAQKEDGRALCLAFSSTTPAGVGTYSAPDTFSISWKQAGAVFYFWYRYYQ
jgi:hypothetical protein